MEEARLLFEELEEDGFGRKAERKRRRPSRAGQFRFRGEVFKLTKEAAAIVSRVATEYRPAERDIIFADGLRRYKALVGGGRRFWISGIEFSVAELAFIERRREEGGGVV